MEGGSSRPLKRRKCDKESTVSISNLPDVIWVTIFSFFWLELLDGCIALVSTDLYRLHQLFFSTPSLSVDYHLFLSDQYHESVMNLTRIPMRYRYRLLKRLKFVNLREHDLFPFYKNIHEQSKAFDQRGKYGRSNAAYCLPFFHIRRLRYIESLLLSLHAVSKTDGELAFTRSITFEETIARVHAIKNAVGDEAYASFVKFFFIHYAINAKSTFKVSAEALREGDGFTVFNVIFESFQKENMGLFVTLKLPHSGNHYFNEHFVEALEGVVKAGLIKVVEE